MPWKSKAQMKAAYGGFLGKKMKDKASEWSAATPNIKKLPEHAKKKTFKEAAKDIVMKHLTKKK